MHEAACAESASSVCPETCDTCDGADEVEMVAPVAAYEYTLPTAACDDSKFGKFWAGELNEEKTCMWLSREPEWQTTLCLETSYSFALFVCPETCGACSDLCEDFDDDLFFVGDEEHDCSWLANSPVLHADLCEREDIRNACQESCNLCDSPKRS
jgi:hypothetical protein